MIVHVTDMTTRDGDDIVCDGYDKHIYKMSYPSPKNRDGNDRYGYDSTNRFFNHNFKCIF